MTCTMHLFVLLSDKERVKSPSPEHMPCGHSDGVSRECLPFKDTDAEAEGEVKACCNAKISSDYEKLARAARRIASRFGGCA